VSINAYMAGQQLSSVQHILSRSGETEKHTVKDFAAFIRTSENCIGSSSTSVLSNGAIVVPGLN